MKKPRSNAPASTGKRLEWLAAHCDDFHLELVGISAGSIITASIGGQHRQIRFVADDLAHAVDEIFATMWRQNNERQQRNERNNHP